MDSELEPVDGTTEGTGVVEVEEDREGYELVNGVWVEKPMGTKSAIVGANLSFAVKGFVRAQKLGYVLGAEGTYRLFPNQPKLTRKPDVSFVLASRVKPGDIPDGDWKIYPDLAAEVVSPNDTADGLETKLDEYLRAGVRLVWVVYIPTRNVWAYRPDGTARLYRATDTLPGEDVLPGFTVPVAELFEGL